MSNKSAIFVLLATLSASTFAFDAGSGRDQAVQQLWQHVAQAIPAQELASLSEQDTAAMKSLIEVFAKNDLLELASNNDLDLLAGAASFADDTNKESLWKRFTSKLASWKQSVANAFKRAEKDMTPEEKTAFEKTTEQMAQETKDKTEAGHKVGLDVARDRAKEIMSKVREVGKIAGWGVIYISTMVVALGLDAAIVIGILALPAVITLAFSLGPVAGATTAAAGVQLLGLVKDKWFWFTHKARAAVGDKLAELPGKLKEAMKKAPPAHQNPDPNSELGKLVVAVTDAAKLSEQAGDPAAETLPADPAAAESAL